MNYYIDIQHAESNPITLSDEKLKFWAISALKKTKDKAELTLRIVDSAEITALNDQYRKKNKPTNVLAFPAQIPETVILDYPLLGDVIICPQIIEEESLELQVEPEAHWAHIVIHGVLHLLGYDHIKEKEAEIMQGIEIQILSELGYKNPYHTEDDKVD